MNEQMLFYLMIVFGAVSALASCMACMLVIRNKADIEKNTKKLNDIRDLISHKPLPAIEDSHYQTTTSKKSSQIERLEPKKLFYCTPDNKPILSIGELDQGRLRRSKRRSIDINTSKLIQIQGVLQAAPSLLTHAAIASGNYMEVIVNGPLAAARTGDALRPIVQGADGKIIEMKLKSPVALNRLGNVAVLWSIASVIVAQKHLSDMKDELRVIKDCLNEIRNFLKTERESVITGALSYLQDQAYPTVMSGEFPAAVRMELESIERKLIEVQNHLHMELRSTVEEIESVKDVDTFGTSKTFATIDEKVNSWHESCKQYALAARTRAACWQVLSAFPEDDALKNNRQRAIVNSIAGDIVGLAESGVDKLRNRLEKVDSKFKNDSDIQIQRANIHKKGNDAKQVFLENLSGIATHINFVSEQYQAFNKPICMAVKLENGRITEAIELLPA
ncbi:MAG: hypothetical protein IPN06_17745 [Burkholderiales bacterium]|nr:hypothetical protein [Burkholderiales bacterium]